MDDPASTFILDGDETKNSLTADWNSFLSQPVVGVQAVVLPKAQSTASRRDLSISFESDLSSLANLEFSTTNNVTDFQITSLESPDNHSVILGLSQRNAGEFTVSLGSALDVLGVRPKGSKAIPDDNGNFQPDGGGQQSPSLVGSIVEILSEDQSLKVCTDPGAQNIVWLSPGQTLRTDMVLTLEPKDTQKALSAIQTTITNQFNLQPKNATLSPPQIICRRTTYGIATTVDGNRRWNISTTYRLTFRFPLGVFIIWVILDPTGLSFSITTSASVTQLLAIIGLDISSISSDLAGVFDNVHPLQLSAGMGSGQLWWRVTLAVTLKNLSVYFRYDSLAQAYSGGLITTNFFATPIDKLLITYNAGQSIDLPDQWPSPEPYYDIRDLSDELQAIPSVLPTAIALAEISYSQSAKIFWIRAKLVSPPQSPPKTAGTKVVPSPFTWDELDIQVVKGPNSFSGTASTHFTVTSPDGLLAAELGLGVTYDSGSWSVTGYAQQLSGALIASFYDPDYREAMTDVLGKLNIADFQLQYTYEKGQNGKAGSASSFAILATVEMGLLELRLFYQYVSSDLTGQSSADILKNQTNTTDQELPATIPKPEPQQQGVTNTDWRFECDLGSSKPGQTVGTVLDSIVDDVSSMLPTFVTDIDFPTADGTQDRSLISIKINKTANGNILFAFRVTISSFTLTFAQIGYSQNTGKKPKRLLRFAADKIPLINNIPLLDQLPQPFEQLEYLWLNGQGDTDGLLQSEVDALNAWVLEGIDQLYYKQIVGQAADQPPPSKDPVVVQPGHHFMVINQNQAVLDHVFFASSQPKPQLLLTSVPNSTAAAVTATSSASAPNSPPSKGSLTFKNGALSITAVTLQYKEQANGNFLWVTMDATLTLGPIAFSLLGFGIGVPISNIHLNDLTGLLHQIQFNLDGLAFAFDKPPILISAGFAHQILYDGTPQRQEIYIGGIGLSFPPYTFVGLGEYAILNDYKSLFLYAKLDGPLVELEFAEITGVRFGFGYNSMVRSPSINEITDFPFINDKAVSGAGNNPIKILQQIINPSSGSEPWISPKQDAYWFAAGLSITAFDLLTVTAVAILAFRDSGLIVTLYADAIAQMPPDENEFLLVYAEIGMIAELNFVDGYFAVEASLAPTSFLLLPECHLYGQFAMTYWFPPSAHSGDWVFSIGGYHSKFTPPEWYPVPKRLGISFSTHGISITGEAYFAITPKCVMGGASLHASLNVGPVNAWLDAAFDAFINFHPLHYEVGFNISVGVECAIDFLFVHVHISASIGASLQLYGPDFGGSAYVDFYLFAFTVNFGASPALPPALSLLQFWELLHKPGPAVESTNQDDLNPVRSLVTFNSGQGEPGDIENEEGAAFKFVLEDGNYDTPKKVNSSSDDNSDPSSNGAGTPWHVRGGSFKFRIKVDFAISHASVAAPPGTTDPAQIFDQDVPAENNQICSRPMRVSQPMTSSLTVTIRSKTSSEIISSWQNIAFDIQKVPTATYGAYSPTTDPLATKDPTAFLDGADATVPLAMGLLIQAPPPILAASLIPPFSLADASRLGILDFRTDAVNGSDWKIENVEPEQAVYLPSQLSVEENKKSNAEKWADMASLWTSLGSSKRDLVSDSTDGLLAMCTEFLGWSVNRNQASPAPQGSSNTDKSTDASWRLKGDPPVRLTASLTDTYLALPRVAIVPTTPSP